jgi:transposase
MSEFIMVACDLHDKTMLLKIGRGREAAEKLSIQNSVAGRRRLVEPLRERSAAAPGGRVIFAYEASGLGFGLYDELTAAGIECHVLAPTKIARSTQQRQQKTDEKDAELILQLLRGHVLAGNPLPTVWIPDAQTRDDRELIRARLDASEKAVAIKTQIQSLLKRHRLTRPTELKSAWTKKAAAWLRLMSRDPAVGAGTRGALASLTRQWEFLEEELKRLDEAAVCLANSPRYCATVAELVKLTGVGVLTALVFLSEMGDVSRFANRRQISAYLGLAPRSYESGAANDRKGHITRQGSARVRRALCQAVWSRIRENGPDHAGYQRLVERNPKHKKIAVVAIMRRLGVRMWHKAHDARSQTAPTEGGGANGQLATAQSKPTPLTQVVAAKPKSRKRSASAPNTPTRGALGAGP